MTTEQIKDALLRAAREAAKEHPMIGLDRRSEWTMRGRLAIQLARQREVIALEKQEIHVDVEYGQESVHELKKVPGDKRIDLIVHERGVQTSNLLAVELKVDDAKARKVDVKDDEKLIALTTECAFRLGIWLRLPRTLEGHPGRYAIYKDGKHGDLCDLF